MLTTFLDDSEPSKIRKSIFIFASMSIFAYFYKLNISAPSAFFSSASSSGNSIEINYIHILKILAAFQCYLLCRLFVSWKISFAIFNKSWKVDEFKEDENLIGLQKELSDFNAIANEKIKLKNELNSVISILEKLLPQQEDMHGIISDISEVSRKTSKDYYKLVELLKSEKIDNGEIQGVCSTFMRFNDLDTSMLMEKIRAIRIRIEKTNEMFDLTLSNLTEFEEKLINFNQSFPSSNYKAVTEINQRSLINSRNIKVVEMWVFELIFPTVISLTSLYICLNPENEWLSTILKSIF
ncbi:hypothetical protein FCV43_19905 [Vibrio genomosp. F6]|uniref:hypothetical protein n=1 Tax=Vibrio genomosp. F6 TaxID=723172 RepID=UPI0010BDBF06|nr:hypothetical protein [Vibrio genomosp. F6]TKF13693.1 hypothetical protein FCV43_19905 [Vibrio genomosp. F6]